MKILGIWDGHDSGASLIEDNEIKFAINEERLTRKKLHIGFPYESIKATLSYLNLKPSDIDIVAVSGLQLSRILARQFTFLDEEFYKFRRRKINKPILERERRFLKYILAKISIKRLKPIVEYQIRKRLKSIGFPQNIKIKVVDHHLAHAASAIFTSGFSKNLCITLDGVGDGLSGTINIYDNGRIERISEIKERDSIGLFFEQVTTILGFRELEDEGKVMAMADYSYSIENEKNELLKFFEVDGLKIKSKYGTIRRYIELEKIKWRTPMEMFAYMAQKTLEAKVLQLFKNAIEFTGIKDVCWSGGVASNVKLNRVIRLYSGLKRWFVFPQMGDGGLAAGAALYVAHEELGIRPKRLENVYLGLDYSEDEVKNTLLKYSDKIDFEKVSSPEGYAADLINKGNYVFWFQGRMEYGPRALGNRSILAPADDENVKELLNIQVKRREWFQPFCPSILEEDSSRVFEDYDNIPDRFMTMTY
ncbi:MAG: carbamoyltransferase N-terminal domain-containing protein, partial [Candidatus Aenigmatarchaeota archaeon]